MISTSTSASIPFTPPWREQERPKPIYYFRAGSVIERGQIEAELSGPHRAGRVFDIELKAAIHAGIHHLLADDDGLDRALAVIEEGDASALSADDQLFLSQIKAVLAEHWPPYRELTAQLTRRREIVPIEAMRRFLVGVENVEATFARGPDGMVAETTLAAIDPIELLAAGSFAYGLLYPGDQTRNFPQPSASADAPTNSRRRPRADGSSAAKGGSKIPDRRSPRGSGR